MADIQRLGQFIEHCGNSTMKPDLAFIERRRPRYSLSDGFVNVVRKWRKTLTSRQLLRPGNAKAITLTDGVPQDRALSLVLLAHAEIG